MGGKRNEQDGFIPEQFFVFSGFYVGNKPGRRFPERLFLLQQYVAFARRSSASAKSICHAYIPAMPDGIVPVYYTKQFIAIGSIALCGNSLVCLHGNRSSLFPDKEKPPGKISCCGNRYVGYLCHLIRAGVG